MNRYTLLIIISLVLLNCRSTKINENCTIDLDFSDVIYEIELPCFKKKNKEVEYHGGKQFTFKYNEGSVLFINNNTEEAPNILSEYLSEKEYSSFVFNDSLNYEGKDASNNTFWKVLKKDGFLRGYLNVPEQYKKTFDKAILSIHPK